MRRGLTKGRVIIHCLWRTLSIPGVTTRLLRQHFSRSVENPLHPCRGYDRLSSASSHFVNCGEPSLHPCRGYDGYHSGEDHHVRWRTLSIPGRGYDEIRLKPGLETTWRTLSIPAGVTTRENIGREKDHSGEPSPSLQGLRQSSDCEVKDLCGEPSPRPAYIFIYRLRLRPRRWSRGSRRRPLTMTWPTSYSQFRTSSGSERFRPKAREVLNFVPGEAARDADLRRVEWRTLQGLRLNITVIRVSPVENPLHPCRVTTYGNRRIKHNRGESSPSLHGLRQRNASPIDNRLWRTLSIPAGVTTFGNAVAV